MLQDVLARRPTEIATLNEGLVAQAQACNLSAPVNQAVAGLVRGLEAQLDALARLGRQVRGQSLQSIDRREE